ncbi:hypothetical protein M758_10G009000 [Ceratodon purpureus]|uniref:Uncharacterized protein n=1 Tax=Ceratodon purpureus TaxID=3225 RepID=A0A8T0GGN1_CERPU|nr:hypothetical protein KC19_10G009600 [Ceratodon purpureus]KAG0602355.1 hypothetical protein M758_10G009000 [Ceratodon purpureus]
MNFRAFAFLLGLLWRHVEVYSILDPFRNHGLPWISELISLSLQNWLTLALDS